MGLLTFFFSFQIWRFEAHHLSKTYDSELYGNIVNFVSSRTVHLQVAERVNARLQYSSETNYLGSSHSVSI